MTKQTSRSRLAFFIAISLCPLLAFGAPVPSQRVVVDGVVTATGVFNLATGIILSVSCVTGCDSITVTSSTGTVNVGNPVQVWGNVGIIGTPVLATGTVNLGGPVNIYGGVSILGQPIQATGTIYVGNPISAVIGSGNVSVTNTVTATGTFLPTPGSIQNINVMNVPGVSVLNVPNIGTLTSITNTVTATATVEVENPVKVYGGVSLLGQPITATGTVQLDPGTTLNVNIKNTPPVSVSNIVTATGTIQISPGTIQNAKVVNIPSVTVSNVPNVVVNSGTTNSKTQAGDGTSIGSGGTGTGLTVTCTNCGGSVTPTTYIWMTPDAVGGASKLHADFFNASGSGKVVKILGVYPTIKTDVAVTGVVSIRYDIYRTSAVGTGGTTAAYKSATVDVAGGNITPRDTNNAALPAQITARHLPTGGATISEWITREQCFVEETNAGTHLCHGQTEVLYGTNAPIGQQYLTLREGQGILLKQGSVASLNNIAFQIVFSVE